MKRYPMAYRVSMLNWFRGDGPQPTHDANGYYLGWIGTLPLGWHAVYLLTGLVPFHIGAALAHPERTIPLVYWGIRNRIARRMRR